MKKLFEPTLGVLYLIIGLAIISLTIYTITLSLRNGDTGRQVSNLTKMVEELTKRVGVIESKLLKE